MLTVDIDRDGIGHPGSPFSLSVVPSVGQIAEFFTAAIITGNDNYGITDVTLGVVVVHVLSPADAGLHVGIADRSLDYIERRHLMVIDVDVFLATCKGSYKD